MECGVPYRDALEMTSDERLALIIAVTEHRTGKTFDFEEFERRLKE